MPGFRIALNDTLQIRACCYTPTQIGLNVLHYYVYAVSGSSVTLAEVASAFEASMGPVYRAMIPSSASWRGIGAKNLTPIQSVEYPDATHTGAGSFGATLAPTQSSGLITLRTVYAGPGYRGRVYTPFPATAANQTNGDPTLAYGVQQTLLVLAMGPSLVITGAGGTASVNQIVFKRKGPLYANPYVSGYIVQPKWATQRRRGMYGRINTLPF